MGQPIEISQTELSGSALRALAGKTDDGAVVRRLLAIALVRPVENSDPMPRLTRQAAFPSWST